MSFFDLKVDISVRYTAKSMFLNILCAFMHVIKCHRLPIVGGCIVECAVKSISVSVNDNGSVPTTSIQLFTVIPLDSAVFNLIFALLNATLVDVKTLLKQSSPQIASCFVTVSLWNSLILEF